MHSVFQEESYGFTALINRKLKLFNKGKLHLEPPLKKKRNNDIRDEPNVTPIKEEVIYSSFSDNEQVFLNEEVKYLELVDILINYTKRALRGIHLGTDDILSASDVQQKLYAVCEEYDIPAISYPANKEVVDVRLWLQNIKIFLISMIHKKQHAIWPTLKGDFNVDLLDMKNLLYDFELKFRTVNEY